MVLVVVFQITAFLMPAFGTWCFAHQLRTAFKSGECSFGRSRYTRDREPIRYWGHILFLVGWVILLPVAFIYFEWNFVQAVQKGTFPL